MILNSLFSDIADKSKQVPLTEPVSLSKQIERFRNKETERFQLLDFRLNHASEQRERYRNRNRTLYRYWSLTCLMIIEAYTARSAPNDNSNGIALSAESKHKMKRLKGLINSIK